MRSLARTWFCVTMTFALLAGACRGRQGGGSDDLTPEQKAAVDAVVAELEATAKAVGGVAESFSGLDAEGDGAFGECPVVTAQFEDGTTNVTVDFGDDGCTSDYYDNNTVSGSVSLALQRVARTVDIVFNDLTVDDLTTSGFASLSLTRDGNTRTLTGTIDLTTTGVGSAAGDLSIRIQLGSLTITVDHADLLITEDAGASYLVAVDAVFLDPLANGNFIPEAGAVTFEVPNDGPGPETITIVIEFDQNSPIDGTVAVTVGNAEPIEYELPNF